MRHAGVLPGMAVLAGLGATFFRPSRSPYVGAVLVFFAAFDLIAVGSDRPMNTVPLATEPLRAVRTSASVVMRDRPISPAILPRGPGSPRGVVGAGACGGPRAAFRCQGIGHRGRSARVPRLGAARRGGSVRVIEYTARSVMLESHSPAPAFLVTSEAYYPGWRAFVDGRPERLALTNVAFRGLPCRPADIASRCVSSLGSCAARPS